MGPLQEPDIRATLARLTVELPGDPRGVADLVGQLFDAEVVAQGGLSCPVVLTFGERQMFRFEIRGPLPCSFDDLVRAIAAWSDPHTLAVIREGQVGVDGSPQEAVIVAAEIDGFRFERAMALRRTAAGAIEGVRILGRNTGFVGVDGWLGVEPEGGIDVFPIGPDGWGPPQVADS